MSGQEGTRTGTAVHLSVIVALGVGQILGWGSTYYLPAVLAKPIAADTGGPWPGSSQAFRLARSLPA